MSTSVLIMIVGMLVPVLAAAPFYILDDRAERRAEWEETARQAGLQRTDTEDVVGQDETDQAKTSPDESSPHEVGQDRPGLREVGQVKADQAATGGDDAEATVRLFPFQDRAAWQADVHESPARSEAA